MNKEYICINDKVEVKNEFNKVKKIDYSDNIEKILIKENVIEQMEIEYKRLLNEKKHNKNISYKSLKKCIITLISIPILLIILPLLLDIINISNFSIFSCLLGIIIPTFLGSFLIYEYNKINRINKGIDISLNYLETELNKEREILMYLKKSKTKSNEFISVPISRRVDDIKELKRLKEKLIIYYNCGFYQYKYQKYLKQGKLNNKLSKTFNEEQIKTAEDYLKEKVYKLNNVS